MSPRQHNTQLYILDRQLQPVPMGIPGELYIGGLGVARGYLNRPELTEERFITNPFCNQPHQRLYKTGDRVRYLADGKVEFLGRLDNQVKIRGFRIELGEIEAQIAQHPTVIEAVVIAREETPGDKRLVAYIVSKSDMKLKIEEIREFLKAKLPDYMIPSIFVSLEELPLTSNGKIDRKALPAPQKILVSSEDIVLPSTPIEELLAGIWSETLGIETVGINNNFFELGGHSLLGTQIIAKANRAGLDLDFKDIFEHQTIAELATVATINNKIEVNQEVSQTENTLGDGKITLEFLKAEAVLDETIYPETSIEFVDQPSNIFLTGATGFVGAFLLYELLQQTDAIIYCLIRAADLESGMNRLQKHLESSLLWHESFSDRIVPVIGDLSKPLLGLSEQQFQMMIHKIDVIYHNGASVNLVYSYSTLKAANVLGTEEIIRLASKVKVKPINYISTVSVLSSQNHAKVTEIAQLSNFSHQYIPSNGYPQTKWVAEKLITIAHDRGIPTSIYRLGRISGHSETGVCNKDDRLYRMIRGFIQINCAPDLDIAVDMTPVDYVSKAVIHLSMRQESLSKIFHLCNHQPISYCQLFDWINEFGYSLKRLSSDQWQTELTSSSENTTDNPLYSLLPILTRNKANNASENAPSKQQQPPDQKTLALNCQNTADGLANTSLVCPPADAKLLTTYFSYLIESGFLHPPSV
ncbi:thioester reductase domain-containing protein [Crocosphaera sp. Alani8]|uniref:thioester reductase domain-containing protein n=1 Tax=Crocosphaera sp. Alani8 TaxID=3038952 RepID=UPI00313F175A